MTDRYRLIGGAGSPYSMKIRALMRYRRIPFDWMLRNHVGDEVAHVKPPVIPILHNRQDDSYRNDSTPLVSYLEEQVPTQRSVIPDDPCDAFLSYLIEDLADEWFTKIMFQHRWFDTKDAEFYGDYLGWFLSGPNDPTKLQKAATFWKSRQVERMPLVGVTVQNQPVIERTFTTLMQTMERLLDQRMFLFGDRPSVADFAIYGQLQPGMFAPGASVQMRDMAPHTYCWLMLTEDLSGWHGASWRESTMDDPSVEALLKIAGDAMLPFYAANLAALKSGADEVTLDIWGTQFTQAPFKYQAKCFAELRRRYAELSAEKRQRLSPLLERTGCLRYLA